MIDFFNPILIYSLSIIGSIGTNWLIKYSNIKSQRKISQLNSVENSAATIIFINIFIIIYLLIHAKIISLFLIDPGFLQRSDGSGGGYYWNENIEDFNKLKIEKKFLFVKTIGEFLYGSIHIAIFLFALHKRGKYKSNNPNEIIKNSNSKLTSLLIIFSLLLTCIAFFGIFLFCEEYFMWEGG